MPKIFHGLLLVVLTFCLNAGDSSASSLDNWNLRSPLPTLRVLRDVSFGNNTFVAVGEEGVILTSSDGIQWSQQPKPTTNTLYDVNFASNQFLAVGGMGARGELLSSSDGTNWTLVQVLPERLRSISHGHGIFVVGGTLGRMYLSYDLTNWVPRTVPGLGGPDNRVFFLATNFIACGGTDSFGSSHSSAWSSDGTNWFMPFTAENPAYSVAYGNGLFVSMNFMDSVTFSKDARNWFRRSTGLLSPLVRDILFNQGRFVAVGVNGAIATSPDGTNWTRQASTLSQQLRGLAFGNGRWVAVGNAGMLLSSDDAITWTVRSKGISDTLFHVSAHQDGLLAAGALGVLAESTNGSHWITRNSGTTSSLYVASRQNGIYLIAGTNGLLRSGPDLDQLESRESHTTNSLLAAAFGNQRYVMVGSRGTILFSEDTLTWNTTLVPVTNDLRGLCFADNAFVAVGRQNTILRSVDGVTWEPRPFVTSAPAHLEDVAYGNGRFVALGPTSQTVALSTNGLDWNLVAGANTTQHSSLDFGGGIFIATGYSGSIRSSPDGIQWSRHDTGYAGTGFIFTGYALYGVGYYNGTFVCVGQEGCIFQSDPVLMLTLSRNPSATLEIPGTSPFPFQIEGYDPGSENPVWKSLATFPRAPVSWTDPESPEPASRLYRARIID